ncbi:MAG TPA: NosD domain-containing protein [Solirubrobacterales bacterium]
MAVKYTVDSTGDQPDEIVGSDGCKTAVDTCTLRAAIRESNNSAAVVDEIAFGATFHGQLEDTIVLESLLPAITDRVSIEPGICATQAGQGGPCAGLEGVGLSSALNIENANGVEIVGLAITGATTGIRVNDSQDFAARINWLGEKLDGSNDSGSTTGIWLGPGSNNATIGAALPGLRNIFVNNAAEGLDIEGADNADVLGNFFGVKADGVTKAANGKNIEITDTVAFAATGNEVGGTISGVATPCHNACNVISGATSAGIDLHGDGGSEKPATGPTTIHGNYIGLGVRRRTVVGNGTYGILSSEANDVMIGGEADGDTNFFAGGGTGIYYEGGEGFAAIGNVIGFGGNGANVASPSEKGLFIYCLGNADPVLVEGNLIKMNGGTAIEEVCGGAEIASNFIEGAQYGILTKGEPHIVGSQIEDNAIGESVANGILIEGDSNEVLGNAIYGSGAAGIRIQNPILSPTVNSTENLIGGNAPADENFILENGGDAIEIDNSGGVEPSYNEVARNLGVENAGLFIDLIGSLTNGGIQPPAFVTSTRSSAGGTGAQPGATIRVFRKETAEAGEIESFLGEVGADAKGNWKVTYPSEVSVGTIVAATQTSVGGGTSELAIATSADPVAVMPTGAPSPRLVPRTKIIKGTIKGNTAKFKFSSDEKGAKFECKLDGKPFKSCKSPKTYKKLTPGKHVFKVRAVKGKDVDPTPAKRKFKILK